MSKEKEIGTCRLCLETKELRYSHIIPELFFRLSYDENSRALEISAEPYKEKPIQKGYREFLLCDVCEKRFEKYETFAGNLCHKTFPTVIESRGIAIEGIEYKRFKLLHLSILWRSSVTSLPEFKHVSLGKKHEEKIREMLLSDDPGPPDEYAFFCSMLHLDKKIIYPFVEPVFSKLDGFTFYIFYFGGVCWNYAVSAMSFRSFSKTIPLFSEEGKLYFVAEDIMKNSHVDRIVRKGIKEESLKSLRGAFKHV